MGGRKRGLSAPLARLRQLIGRSLERTAPLWPDVERTYAWVHAAARVLGNEGGEDATTVRCRFNGLVGAMHRHRDLAGALAPAIDRVAKVARSCRPGLFPCCAVPGLPRTNNGLEQLFGSQRYHERHATRRKAASPAAVLRGEVRLIAATATRIRPPSGRELGRAGRQAWSELRHRLDQRRYARTLRTRFRRNPEAYLAELKQQTRQPTLPT